MAPERRAATQTHSPRRQVPFLQSPTRRGLLRDLGRFQASAVACKQPLTRGRAGHAGRCGRCGRPLRAAGWTVADNLFERAICHQTRRIARWSRVFPSGRAIRRCPRRIGGSSRSHRATDADAAGSHRKRRLAQPAGWWRSPAGGRCEDDQQALGRAVRTGQVPTDQAQVLIEQTRVRPEHAQLPTNAQAADITPVEPHP
jgi:hypothetical protein